MASTPEPPTTPSKPDPAAPLPNIGPTFITSVLVGLVAVALLSLWVLSEDDRSVRFAWIGWSFLIGAGIGVVWSAVVAFVTVVDPRKTKPADVETAGFGTPGELITALSSAPRWLPSR